MAQTRKENCYDRLVELNIEENLINALCNWFDSRELEEFVEFLEEERYLTF